VNLSAHFSLEEAVSSETAARSSIPNIPSDSVIQQMKFTANHMEDVRRVLGNKSIHINSWYRSLELNTAVGSKPTSQHITGQAVDFICPAYGEPLEICKTLIWNSHIVPFDQLILEHTWVHISFAIPNTQPRNQVLSLLEDKHYANGLTDKYGRVPNEY
jgi:zinc D-Ala-D-Ala carboxypeptidase